MKVSILFLYFSVARATDDSSLMQQGVGIESGVLIGSVNEAFQTRLTTVQDALKEIPHQGKMRQMAIDSLMQAVAKKSNGTEMAAPTVAEQLTQVVELLWDLLNGFQAEIENEVQALQTKAQAITDCNDAGTAQDASHENTSDTAQTTHQTCRIGTDGELTKRNTVETDCRDLINRVEEFRAQSDPGAYGTCTGHMSSIPCSGACADYTLGKYATDVPHVFEQNGGGIKQIDGVDIQHVSVESSDWTDYQTNMKNFWDGQNTYWTTRAGTCKTSTQAWDTKRDDCNTKQNTYEQAFCTWVSYRRSRCTTLSTCHPAKTTEFETLNDTHTTHDNNRVAVAEIVQRVICLVGVLAADGGNLDSYPTNSDACITKVTNNATAIRSAMTRAKPVPDPIDDCFDVSRPWPSDTNSGTQHAETETPDAAFDSWFVDKFAAIQTQFTNAALPDNDLDFTTTSRAECIASVA